MSPTAYNKVIPFPGHNQNSFGDVQGSKVARKPMTNDSRMLPSKEELQHFIGIYSPFPWVAKLSLMAFVGIIMTALRVTLDVLLIPALLVSIGDIVLNLCADIYNGEQIGYSPFRTLLMYCACLFGLTLVMVFEQVFSNYVTSPFILAIITKHYVLYSLSSVFLFSGIGRIANAFERLGFPVRKLYKNIIASFKDDARQ